MNQYKLSNRYYELTDSQISSEEVNDKTNTTAKNLQEFIESVRDNHGYYLARYEASYGSGYDATDSTPYANAKPLSQKSTANSEDTMEYVRRTLWNYITQPNAATVCRNMYERNTVVGVESDLANSYAWDTAIIYIQAMGNTNYANANKNTTGNNTILKNTGDTEDQKCHIFDMAANCYEWTTEYSDYSLSDVYYPYTLIGCSFNGYYNTSTRHSQASQTIYSDYSFRVILYI